MPTKQLVLNQNGGTTVTIDPTNSNELDFVNSSNGEKTFLVSSIGTDGSSSVQATNYLNGVQTAQSTVATSAAGAVSIALSGAGYNITANNAVIAESDNASATVAGSGLTFNLGKSVTLSDTSSGSTTINLNGGSDGVTVVGTGLTLNGVNAGSVATLGANTSAVVNGNGGTINVTGTSSTLVESGSVNKVNVSGTSDTTTIGGAGTQSTIAGWKDQTNVTGQSAVTNVTGSGADDTLVTGTSAVTNVSGNYNYTTIAGWKEQTSITGTDTTNVTGSGGDDTNVTGTSAVTNVSGNYNYTTIAGWKEQTSIIGTDTTNVTGSGGDDTTVTGTSAVTNVSGNYNQTTIAGWKEQTSIIGTDTTNITGSGDDNANVTGTSAVTNVSGNYDFITIAGWKEQTSVGGTDTTTVTGSGDDDTWQMGTKDSTTVTGNYDFIYNYGGADTTTSRGSGDQSYNHGIGDITYNYGSGDGGFNSGTSDNVYNYGPDETGSATSGSDSTYNYNNSDTTTTPTPGNDEPNPIPTECDDGDPVILNLRGGKVDTQGLATSTARFDMQNNGLKDQTGWATAGEGLLVDDRAGSNRVRSDADLVAGMSALDSLDSNHDGRLDARDAAWKDLKVWVDGDGSANFHASDLHSLDQLGIASISLNARYVDRPSHGNTLLDDSSFTWADGSTGDIAGVDLAFRPSQQLDPLESSSGSSLEQLDSIGATWNQLDTIGASYNQLISAMASFAPPAGIAEAASNRQTGWSASLLTMPQ